MQRYNAKWIQHFFGGDSEEIIMDIGRHKDHKTAFAFAQSVSHHLLPFRKLREVTLHPVQ